MERALETPSGAIEGSDVPCTEHYDRNLKQGGALHRRRSFPGCDFGHLRDYFGNLRDYFGHLRYYFCHLRDYFSRKRLKYFSKFF